MLRDFTHMVCEALLKRDVFRHESLMCKIMLDVITT